MTGGKRRGSGIPVTPIDHCLSCRMGQHGEPTLFCNCQCHKH